MNLPVQTFSNTGGSPPHLHHSMKLLTTQESAERLGVTVRRVQAMIRDGRLPAEKMGRDWFIKEEDLELVADRKPGRPKKAQADVSAEPEPSQDVVAAKSKVKATRKRKGAKKGGAR
jgi:excisionase family DNA binding protein